MTSILWLPYSYLLIASGGLIVVTNLGERDWHERDDTLRLIFVFVPLGVLVVGALSGALLARAQDEP